MDTGTLRTFAKDVPDEDLVWHRDHEDRTIRVLSESVGWHLQFDNEQPFELLPLTEVFIPKNYFHRLIKVNPSGPLIINIEKN